MVERANSVEGFARVCAIRLLMSLATPAFGSLEARCWPQKKLWAMIQVGWAPDPRLEEDGWIESMSLAQTKERGEQRAEGLKLPFTKRMVET